jgi:cell division protein FtsW
MTARIRTDWPLFAAIMVILCFGLVMVYSASSVVARSIYDKQIWEFAARQLAAALVGIALLLLLKRLDYRVLQHPAWVCTFVLLTGVLLILVMLVDPVSHRWFRIAGFSFQPSEMAKPALVLFLAWFVSRRENKINDRYTLAPASAVLGGLSALIAIGDLGTAMLVLTPAIIVFYVAGIERKYFALSIVLALLLAGWFFYQKPYRILRVTSHFGIEEKQLLQNPNFTWLAGLMATSGAYRDADYQPRQAKLAIGSGGVAGVGIGLSNQKLGFLPEAHTDFIFGVIGEETGFIGSATLVALYMVVFWRGFRVYWLTPDSFGRYLALGCTSLFGIQALLNMTVVLGLAPTKGIPLPLVSYGGSSLICMMITLGMLLSVADRAASD